MLRAGIDNELAPYAEKESVVAIGWAEMGDLSGLKTREQFKERYQQIYPDHARGRVNVKAIQVFRFACDIRETDYALTYIKDSGKILIGLVAGPYAYRLNLFGDAVSEAYPHIRPVQGLKCESRDAFLEREYKSKVPLRKLWVPAEWEGYAISPYVTLLQSF